MELLNPQEHISCSYYGCGKNNVIEVRRFLRGHREKLIFEKNEILFIMEGGLRFIYKDYLEQTVEKGRFFFVPSGGEFSFTTVKKSLVMVIRLQNNAYLCEGCSIEQLYKDKVESGTSKGNCEAGIQTLEINPPIWNFLGGLNDSIAGGLNCLYYHDTKIKEMLILLRAYYSREDLWDFFSLILSPNTEFSEYVRNNHYKYKTVGELAASINMEPKYFAKKFIKVFSESPVRWMKKEKARMILAELHSGQLTMAQLSDKYGFLAPPHFNKFCKRELGKNPGEIRNEKKV